MESKIKWQKGCPEQSGNYIVTMSTGEVTVKEFYNPHTSHSYWEDVEEDDEVIAWCKLSDIEPYKEKTMEEQKAIPPYMDYDVRAKETMKEIKIEIPTDL